MVIEETESLRLIPLIFDVICTTTHVWSRSHKSGRCWASISTRQIRASAEPHRRCCSRWRPSCSGKSPPHHAAAKAPCSAPRSLSGASKSGRSNAAAAAGLNWIFAWPLLGLSGRELNRPKRMTKNRTSPNIRVKPFPRKIRLHLVQQRNAPRLFRAFRGKGGVI